MKILAFLLFFTFSSFAFAQVEFVWGINESLDQYKIQADKFKKIIEEQTKGEVLVKVVLYKKDPQRPFELIKNDSFHMYQITTDNVQERTKTKYPFLDAWHVPFVFKNPEHVEKYINSKRSMNNLKLLETDDYLAFNYSYAGGFVSVIDKNPVHNQMHLKDLRNFCPMTELSGENDKNKQNFAAQFHQKLPCLALLYELNEFKNFADKLPQEVFINLTYHKVVSRVSVISKKFLSQLSIKHKDLFLSHLNSILAEERAIVNERGRQNLKRIGNIPNLKMVRLKDVQHQVKPDPNRSQSLQSEIDFIRGLEEIKQEQASK